MSVAGSCVWADPITTAQHGAIDLRPYTKHVVENCDKEGLSVEDVHRLFQSMQSDALPTPQSTYGYTPCEQWFHWSPRALPLVAGDWWLQIAPTFLDEVEVYALTGDVVIQRERLGDHVGLPARSLPSRHLLVRLDSTDTPTDYYVRVRTTSTLTLTMTLRTPENYGVYASHENLFYGVLFGLTAAALVICFMGGVWFRERFYVAAGVFLFFNAFTHFTLIGFDLYYLFPENAMLSDRMMGVGVYGAGASALFLYLVFLQPANYLPWLTRLAWVWVGVTTLGALVSAIGYPYPNIAAVGSLITMAFALAIPLAMLRYRRREALLMLVIFLPQWLSLLVQLLRNFAVLPISFWTTHIWAITSLLLIPFVSIVVMMRLREQEQSYLAETEKARMHRNLFNMVAHELRTPLAIVSGALANLELQTEAQKAQLAPRFSRANLGLARLNALIDTALLEDRLLDEGIVLQPTPIDIESWLHEVVQLRVIEAPHQLVIMPVEPSITVRVDEHWLSLALLNLIDNAIKYSPDGGDIAIDVQRTSTDIHIRVSDQGIGIAPGDHEKLREKFYRADNARALRATQGLGLGLFLVDRIMDLHGGTLACESLDQGSRFSLVLPASCASDPLNNHA